MTQDLPAQLVRSLSGPLELEARRGYPDSAVIGRSLAEYARDWARRVRGTLSDPEIALWCDEICDALADYAQSGPDQRRARVEQARRLLGGLGVASGQQPETAGCRADRPSMSTEKAALGQACARGDSSVLQEDFLDLPIASLPGVAPNWMKPLAKLGIATNRDLLYYFPREYLPLRRLADVQDGERAVVAARVQGREETVIRQGRGFRLVRFALQVSDDDTQAWVISFARVPRAGARRLAIWHSPLSLAYSAGTDLLIEGSVRRAGRYIEIHCARSEPRDAESGLAPGMLFPVYPLTEGVYQGQVRRVVRSVLANLPQDLADPIAPSLRLRHGLLPLAEALRTIHFPASAQARDGALRRMAFEELVTVQVAVTQRRLEIQRPGAGIAMPPRGDIVAMFEEVLPFSLTKAQQRVISEIAADMGSDRPMHRLIQGDVGSGKTLVAAAALMIALQNGHQGALMAPTELLAEQHYLVLSRLLDPLGVSVQLLTGAMRGREREEAGSDIASGRAQVVVGTHALIQEGVAFHRLGLAIIDEQHRFGVRQRGRLRTKGRQPDTLVMTATPIPRTLALTLYGDLDLSVLDEMPPGRRAVLTRWLPQSRQGEACQFVRDQVAGGRQAYLVCPLIEESESTQAKAATKLAEQLRTETYPDLRVGLLHGALKVAERAGVMEAFRAGKMDVLVTTTVIEVGVDVPNATVMMILNAERFGLAQLHQLRGRVGRGEHTSHCLLLTDRRYDPWREAAAPKEESVNLTRRRLRVLVEESDGFRIAEEDLLLRGPGEFYGTRQHGLPDLRLARMARDVGVLEEARAAALWLTERDPLLAEPQHGALREQVQALRARMDGAAG